MRKERLAVHAIVVAAVAVAFVVRPEPLAASPATTVSANANVVPTKFANNDPDDDLIVAPPAPRATCEDDLRAAGIKWRPAKLPVHEVGKKHKWSCGAEQVLIYESGPAKIRYEPSPLVTCNLALALARLDAVILEESTRTLGKPVVRIKQLGTYACREMANYPGWVSEHSYANAIDLETFVLKDGSEVSVLKFFDKSAEGPKKKQGRFLLDVARRAYDEDVFSTVLTPFFDALHRNHFHVDLSRYRSDGTREVTP